MEKETIINLDATDLDWSEREIVSAQLGDKRLNKRLQTIIEAFSAKPQASIPEAMGSWVQSKATYRFFDNPKVTSEKIIQAHRETTGVRSKRESVLLAIQDTSFVDYTDHPATKNLGFLSDENHTGLIIHPTLISTAEGVPLGIIDLQLLKRETIGTRDKWYERPIEAKESNKWINSYRATCVFAKEHHLTNIINVADREADVYELFEEAVQKKALVVQSPDVLVRAAWNRKLQDEHRYLWEHLGSQEIAAETIVELSRNNKRTARKATLSVRYAAITLRPPRRCSKSKRLEPVALWAIYLNEDTPPAAEEAISWMLLTTVPVTDSAQALELVSYYVRRWLIESYFKVLKSGCQIEERQLQAEQRLINCLAVDCIIAWRILFLTMIGRALPEIPASVIFERAECFALYSFIHKTNQVPEHRYTLSELIFELGKLGGFLGRSQDGYPGITCIWRGMWRLADITATWKLFNSNIENNDHNDL